MTAKPPRLSAVERRHQETLAEGKGANRIALVAILVAAAMAMFGAFIAFLGSRLPAPPSASADLVVVDSWPVGLACDAATSVAVSEAMKDQFAESKWDRESIAESGGAAYGSGYLTIALSTVSPNAVQIVNIEPMIRQVDPTIGWVAGVDGGCGAPTSRLLALDLDRRVLADLGETTGEGVDYRALDPGDPGTQISTYAVSSSSPLTLVVRTFGCESSYEFDLSLDYVLAGSSEVKTTTVGPYRVYGPKPAIPYYISYSPEETVFSGEAASVPFICRGTLG